MRFVIDHEFLDKASRYSGLYHYIGKLVRHGSDGNPIIWMNIARSGITLWGTDSKLISPSVSDQCLNDGTEIPEAGPEAGFLGSATVFLTLRRI